MGCPSLASRRVIVHNVKCEMHQLKEHHRGISFSPLRESERRIVGENVYNPRLSYVGDPFSQTSTPTVLSRDTLRNE